MLIKVTYKKYFASQRTEGSLADKLYFLLFISQESGFDSLRNWGLVDLFVCLFIFTIKFQNSEKSIFYALSWSMF